MKSLKLPDILLKAVVCQHPYITGLSCFDMCKRFFPNPKRKLNRNILYVQEDCKIRRPIRKSFISCFFKGKTRTESKRSEIF